VLWFALAVVLLLSLVTLLAPLEEVGDGSAAALPPSE
jgi:hypothetical protein